MLGVPSVREYPESVSAEEMSKKCEAVYFEYEPGDGYEFARKGDVASMVDSLELWVIKLFST